MAGMLCFMAESAVEQGYVGFELLLEDIDQGEIGPGAKRVVVELGRNPAADRLGITTVAATGALDAQFERSQHGDGPVHATFKARIEEDGALEDHVVTALTLGPGSEIGHHGRVDQRIEIGPCSVVAEDAVGQPRTVEFTAAVALRTEAGHDTARSASDEVMSRLASASES